MQRTIDNLGMLKIHRLPRNTEAEFSFNQEEPWAQKLLAELNDSLEPEDIDNSLDLSLKLQKKFNDRYGEYIIAEMHLKIDFTTRCVRSLMPMQDKISIETNAAFLEDRLQDSDELQDSSDIFIDAALRELYFYEKKQINIYELIHEHVFLNRNPYPALQAVLEPINDTKC